MSDDERLLPPPSRPADRVSRREALGALAACLAGGPVAAAPHPGPFRLATFSAEVTPPLGHALMGGGIAPAQEIDDPLFAQGFVLLGGGAAGRAGRGRLVRDPQRRLRPLARGPGRGRRHRARSASWSRASTSTTPPSPTSTPSACSTSSKRGRQHLRPRLPRAGRPARGPGGPRGPGDGRGRSRTSAPARRRSRRSRRTAATSAPDGKPAFDRMSATRDPELREQPEGPSTPG